tara:strand:- start:35 stop:493 length:459 start_codon:yes stop_codon:yes gene_type:complete
VNASNRLCEQLICQYADFKKIEKKQFIGYKVSEKRNLNYYSVVTGLFRYKARSVSDNSYSSLYQRGNGFYEEIMKDKVSVFEKKEDAIKFLEKFPNFIDYTTELVLLEITISGNLHSVKCSNNFHKNLNAVAGCYMEKIKEIKVIFNNRKNN